MLRSLHIENIAVIRRADLEPENGFSVLTGETGAGKSIIIDSINLLMGNRVAREILRTGESKALVSAVFEEIAPGVCNALGEMGFPCEDGTLMLQKELTADGRSRARINGQGVTQGVLRDVSRMLVSIHGQADNQKLMQKSSHGKLLDAYVHPEQPLAAYQAVYGQWREITRKLEEVTVDEAEKLRLREMLTFQIADIDSLKLKPGEEERLTRERDRLLNLERINKQVDLAYRVLRGSEKGSAYDLVARAKNALDSLSGLVEGTEELSDRLSAVRSEIEDVAELVAAFADDDREDPTERIDRIEGRLEAISKLKRKYGATVEEVLSFRADAVAKLEKLELSDESRAQLEKEAKALKMQAASLAAELTALRCRGAKEVEAQVTDALAFLDMPKVRFAVRIQPAELCESGGDDVEFLIATNPGEPLLPMIKIASGGELSRIMLALRSVINDRDGAATVIFDEVDTGISGKTSRKVGIKLKQTAKETQVLCVTHSAQIASLADAHYLISKQERNGRAETDVMLLTEEERIEEVARILGGISVTDAQRAAAREMIQEYR